jgi:chemotaxis protein MotB
MGEAKPVIIKKKKGGHGHGGHHGGAWKVAYADFVTAMMAFFLVMWILGLSESTRRAIAGYFREPGLFSHVTGKGQPLSITGDGQSLHRGDGSGAATGKRRSDLFDIGPYQRGGGAGKGDGVSANTVQKEVAEALRKLGDRDPGLRVILGSVSVRITAEGLRVELADSKEAAFFELGSARPSRAAREVLGALAAQLGKLDNRVEIEGHTDGRAYGAGAGYTNWDLSVDRANATRRLLVERGVPERMITSVAGFADTKLHKPDQPLAPSNRRVTLVVRYGAAQEIPARRPAAFRPISDEEIRRADGHQGRHGAADSEARVKGENHER